MRKHLFGNFLLTTLKAVWNFSNISIGYMLKGGEWNQLCDQDNEDCFKAVRNCVPIVIAGSFNLIARKLKNSAIDCIGDRELTTYYSSPSLSYFFTLGTMTITILAAYKLDINSASTHNTGDEVVAGLLMSLLFTALDETQVNLLKYFNFKVNEKIRQVTVQAVDQNPVTESSSLIRSNR